MGAVANRLYDSNLNVYRNVLMDIILTRAIHFLTGLFTPFWLILAAAILILALFVQRNVVNPVKQKFLHRAVFAFSIPFILVCICSGLLQNYFVNKQLRSFAKNAVDSLIISTGEKRIEITDPTTIGNLLSLICRGREVSAHHTHPVDKIKLSIPKAGYTYSLGKDSEIKDEFWLEWLSYPGSDPSISSITIVRQFFSSELSGWLDQYVGKMQ